MRFLILKIVLFVPAMYFLYVIGKTSGMLTCWSSKASGRLSKSLRLDPARKSLV